MAPRSALRRREAAETARKQKPLDLQTFAKAFVASLVDNGLNAVYPHDARDMAGFKAVVEELAARVQHARKGGASKEDVLPLLKIVNELRASNTGSFDGFEAALRSLQLTFTSSPNPFHSVIQFPVSRNQARSYSSMLSEEYAALARDAATAFLSARKQVRA